MSATFLAQILILNHECSINCFNIDDEVLKYVIGLYTECLFVWLSVSKKNLADLFF